MLIARHDDKSRYWMVISDAAADQAVKDDLEKAIIRMYEQRSKN